MKKIIFNNFKAFGERTQVFSKKPITLVYGPNSIGKSSLLHFMAYRKKILEGILDPIDIQYGDTISLGGFNSFVHKKNNNTKITTSYPSIYKSLYIETEIGLSKENNSIINKHTKYIYRNNVLIEVSHNEKNNYTVTLNLSHSFFEKKLKNLESEFKWTRNKINKALGNSKKLSFNIDFDNSIFLEFGSEYQYEQQFYDRAEEEFEKNIEWSLKDEEVKLSVKEFKKYSKDILGKNFFGVDIKEETKKYLEKNKDAKKIIERISISNYNDDEIVSLKLLLKDYSIDLLGIFNTSIEIKEKSKKFYYMGPLRFYPKRNDNLESSEYLNILNSRSFWSILRDNPNMIKTINNWLSCDKLNTPYEIKIHKKYDLTNLFKENIDCYSKTDIENFSVSDKELVFEDKRSNTLVHHREIGLGVTQILPIIGLSLLCKDTTIAVEQPELHLHPKIQCEIADEFIRSYKENKNEFIIETHSEHLLLRIMKRMRHAYEDRPDRDKTLDITPDDICLLYIDNNGEFTYLNELELDNDGSLLDPWPNGFFEEGHNERFD